MFKWPARSQSSLCFLAGCPSSKLRGKGERDNYKAGTPRNADEGSGEQDDQKQA